MNVDIHGLLTLSRPSKPTVPTLWCLTGHFTGTDTFTYTITDGVLMDTAVVTVTVLPLAGDYVVYLPVILKPEE